MSAPSSPEAIPSLDGWRAVAIILVFLSHAGWGHLVPGGLGVTIFFFLSGFLITTLMQRETLRSGGFNLRHFYIRRALRLLPPFVAVLVLAYGLAGLGWLVGGASWRGFLAQLFYLSNYYQLYFSTVGGAPAGTGVYWSLAVEEHFYFLFPLLYVFVLMKSAPQRCLVVLYGLCAAVLLWRIVLIAALQASGDRTYYATDTRLDSIVFGCALAVLMRLPAVVQWASRPWVARVLILSGLVGLAVSLGWRGELFRNTARYSLQGLALTPLFFYSVRHPGWAMWRVLNHRLLMRVGVLSYSLYLVHYVVISNLEGHIGSRGGLAALALAISLLLAWLMERWIDEPLLAVRRRFR